MYISMKFGTEVRVFCWEVGVFKCSYFYSACCKITVQISYLVCIMGKVGNALLSKILQNNSMSKRKGNFDLMVV